MFRFAELLIICMFLYLIANLLRFVFFKSSGGGHCLFGLSDKWIEKEKGGK